MPTTTHLRNRESAVATDGDLNALVKWIRSDTASTQGRTIDSLFLVAALSRVSATHPSNKICPLSSSCENRMVATANRKNEITLGKTTLNTN